MFTTKNIILATAFGLILLTLLVVNQGYLIEESEDYETFFPPKLTKDHLTGYQVIEKYGKSWQGMPYSDFVKEFGRGREGEFMGNHTPEISPSKKFASYFLKRRSPNSYEGISFSITDNKIDSYSISINYVNTFH